MVSPVGVDGRRRESGTDSARSLLLTILGEFVFPRGGPVWTGSLLDALGSVGVEEKAARQSLARAAGEGLLDSQRHGRRVQWALTPAGERLLKEGTDRIYGFMRERRVWDGQWLVLTVAIPESQRQLRHRLRTRLTWLGLGSPAPGLWVVPDAAKEDATLRVLEELDLREKAFAWVGRAAELADQRRLLAQSWELAAVRQRYQEFIASFSRRTVASAAETFTAQVQLVQEWRRFPFLDPDLPGELLDPDWPGPAAAALFHDRRARWHRQAQSEWDRLEAGAAART